MVAATDGLPQEHQQANYACTGQGTFSLAKCLYLHFQSMHDQSLTIDADANLVVATQLRIG